MLLVLTNVNPENDVMPQKEPESVQRRLDLSRKSVEEAKIAFAIKTTGNPPKSLEKVEFRKMLDDAVAEYLPAITAALEAIQLFQETSTDVEKRPRPVSLDTWDFLGRTGEKHDLSRLQLVRCVLHLLANSNKAKQ